MIDNTKSFFFENNKKDKLHIFFLSLRVEIVLFEQLNEHLNDFCKTQIVFGYKNVLMIDETGLFLITFHI